MLRLQPGQQAPVSWRSRVSVGNAGDRNMNILWNRCRRRRRHGSAGSQYVSVGVAGKQVLVGLIMLRQRMGGVAPVRSNNSLEILTAERACLNIQVLVFCVIDRGTHRPHPLGTPCRLNQTTAIIYPPFHGCTSLSAASHFPPEQAENSRVTQATEQGRWRTPLPALIKSWLRRNVSPGS